MDVLYKYIYIKRPQRSPRLTESERKIYRVKERPGKSQCLINIYVQLYCKYSHVMINKYYKNNVYINQVYGNEILSLLSSDHCF